MPSKCPPPCPHPACVPVCKLSRVPRSVSCVLRPSLLPFLSPSPLLSLCLSLFFYFPENQFEERAKGKKESARNPGINPGARTWCRCRLIPPRPEPPRPPVKLPPAGPQSSPSSPSPPRLPASLLRRLSLTLTPLIGTGGRHGGGITSPGGEAGGWAEWACRIQGGGLWLGWGTAFSLTHWALVAGPCWHGCPARMPAHPTGFHRSRLPHFSGSWGAVWGGRMWREEGAQMTGGSLLLLKEDVGANTPVAPPRGLGASRGEPRIPAQPMALPGAFPKSGLFLWV